jgi:biotin transport system substrate-specific component
MTLAPAPATRSTARSSARDLAQIAVFAALIAALTLPGAIPTGVGVPITLQTLGVMLAGAILGARKGALAVAVYVLLGLIGLPILAGASAGLGVLAGPSGGFLLGFIPGAFVVGWFTARLLPKLPFWAYLGGVATGGILVVYLIGVPWLAVVLDLPLWTAIVANAPYLPGDIVKVVVTVVVARAVHRAWPGLIAPRRWPWARRDAAPLAEPGAVDSSR